jgi:hypothetical protein
MPRKGHATKKCAREGLGPVKPGKRGWVFGSKLPFFQGQKEEYLAATEIKGTGGFYSKMSQRYLDKYRYHTDWDEDLDEGQDVADDVDPDEDVDNLPEAEENERLEYYQKLRGVSQFVEG